MSYSGDRAVIRAAIWRGRERIPSTVVVEDGTIVEVAFGRSLDEPGARQFEFPDGTLFAGFSDLHVHGGGGADAAGPEGDLPKLGRWLAAQGVTSFLATIPALPWEQLTAAVRRGAAACAAADPPNLRGLHLEGPFLSPARAGAQPPEGLCPARAASYRALRASAGVHLKMMTLAPELPGAGEVIAACVRDGVVAAAGHTDASYEQAVAGFSRGVRHVTHLYNAMRPFHHRDPGVVGAALSLPGITAEIILDGHHVHRAAFEIAFRVLGPQSLALVSDALPLTGAQSACGAWAGRSLARSGTRVTLDSGALAGGGCALCKAVARAVSWGADPPAAAEMASLAPAAVLGLASRKGRVLPGYDADLVVIDQRWNVLLTLIGGLQAWPAPARAPL